VLVQSIQCKQRSNQQHNAGGDHVYRGVIGQPADNNVANHGTSAIGKQDCRYHNRIKADYLLEIRHEIAECGEGSGDDKEAGAIGGPDRFMAERSQFSP